MSILVVDDSLVSRTLIADLLNEVGFRELILCGSAEEAYIEIGFDNPAQTETDLDLILLDINLPGISGLEACHCLSQHPLFRDVPIIIISAIGQTEGLDAAFSAGATDYITKPPGRTELLGRVRAALRLKKEMDRRKVRETELLVLNQRLADMNQALEKLSVTDSLTGLANRRSFNEFLQQEWLREQRSRNPFAVIMIDIDHFKRYNDHYGHMEGDTCLQKVALALQGGISRASDLLARYGGEEFVAVLPNTDLRGAEEIAANLHACIAELGIPHAASPVSSKLTISIGIASQVPVQGALPTSILTMADAALYQAKQSGRNQTAISETTGDLAAK